jgi:hypothetical protein
MEHHIDDEPETPMAAASRTHFVGPVSIVHGRMPEDQREVVDRFSVRLQQIHAELKEWGADTGFANQSQFPQFFQMVMPCTTWWYRDRNGLHKQ